MVYFQFIYFKETTNPDKMEIKDELDLNSKTWETEDDIEYNTIGAFQTSDSNTPGFFWWTFNPYTL